MMKFVAVIIVIAILSIGKVSPFSPTTTSSAGSRRSSSSIYKYKHNSNKCLTSSTPFVLSAKAKKGNAAGGKKNSKKQHHFEVGVGAAGFGATPTMAHNKKGPKEQNDYTAFPALEEHVSKTLVASSSLHGSDGDDRGGVVGAEDLPIEIYDRLAGIYGFRTFNYLDIQEEQQEVPVMSFQELLTSGRSQPEVSPSSSMSSFGDLLKPSSLGNNLGSLLSFATGGDEGIGSAATTEIMKHNNWSIDKLPAFKKFKVLHVDPLVISVENFFTPEECDHYVAVSEAPPKNFDSPLQSRSRTVGKDSQAQAQRTSTTWYHHYKGVPELMAKAARLFGLDTIHHFEEPQTVRYRRSEKFTWHLDALAPGGDALAKAGQRTATLLVYLTDLTDEEGGATMFRDLGGPNGPLKVRPQKGVALVFFPAAGGIEGQPLDIRTLHCGEAVSEQSKQDKWIAQLWLREKPYQPTAPPGNTHDKAWEAISDYCNNVSSLI